MLTMSSANLGATESNTHLVKKYFLHFNTHDWDAMAAMYTENALFKDPVLGFGTFSKSRDAIITQYTELSDMIPDVQDSIVNIYPAGKQHVIVEFVSNGTAPNGEKFLLPVCTIFKIEDGLITQDFTYYDNF